MKNIFCFTLVLLIPFLAASQENEYKEIVADDAPQNELKINLLEILIMPAIGITYERFINQHSSFGAYGFINFDLDEEYRYEKFELAPFYRIYLNSKKTAANKGLYTEIFTGFNIGETFYFDYQDSDYYGEGDYIFQEYFGISLGVDLGYKFVNYNNFSFEVFAGAGRYLNEQYIRAYPRVGLSVGKRF